MYINCHKTKAFKLFNAGKRPAEIFNELPLKKTTIFRYFQDWKKKHLKAELERCWKRRIESCETQIQQIKRYPESHQKGELAKWQSQKSIAERRLRNPLSTTDEEKSYFRRYYSFKF